MIQKIQIDLKRELKDVNGLFILRIRRKVETNVRYITQMFYFI